MDCSTPGFPVHHQLPELTQIHVHRVGDAIQPSHPLLFPSPPTFNLSQHQDLFQWVRCSKYWNFSFSISPSNEYSGLISFRMDWLDLLAVQGTLKSPLQYHSSKSSGLQCSAFFTVQLSQPLTSFNFHNYPSRALESPDYIDIFRMTLLWRKGENMSESSPKSPGVI